MHQDTLVEPIRPSPRLGPGRLPSANTRFGASPRGQGVWLVIWLTAGGIFFGHSLWVWAKYAWGSELYSYVLIIPFISLYLAWSKARPILMNSGPVHRVTAIPFIVGFGVLAGHLCLAGLGWQASFNDQLALQILAFVCFAAGGGFLFFSMETLRRAKFALAFLLFMVPPPDALRSWFESSLQHRSADAAQLLFALAGMPALRHGTVFQLPGFSLEVAPECSGIHSTLVLFITSLVAGYLLLQSPWKRALLTLLVIPLGVLRNGFRILTIGELCVNVSPDMINSYIHRRGGPIFFALSLIPFFLLLLYLRKRERNLACSGPESIENT